MCTWYIRIIIIYYHNNKLLYNIIAIILYYFILYVYVLYEVLTWIYMYVLASASPTLEVKPIL